MAEEFVDFEFLMTFAGEIPAWALSHEGMWEARAMRSFIEAVRGPLRPSENLELVFAEDVKPDARRVAQAKIAARDGAGVSRVVLTADDWL